MLAHIASPRSNDFLYGLASSYRHSYDHFWPQGSLLKAISKTNPSILVPADDRILTALMLLHDARRNRFGCGDHIVQLIESSLGNLSSYAVLINRAAFMEEARTLGIAAPLTKPVSSKAAVSKVVNEIGFPVVLKLDGTSGGTGIAMASDPNDAASKCRMLLSPWRRIKKKFGSSFRGEGSILASREEWAKPALNAQAYIQGRPATTSFACWAGELIGAIHAEVLQEAWANGPATVVKIVTNDQMETNARKIALRFGLSGVHGLDYVIDETTKIPWLVEINPRLTQTAHLALGRGRDLASCLLECAIKRPVVPRQVKIDSELIALFPQEILRDRNSAFLRSAYHDVPSNNPDFTGAVFGKKV